MSIQSEINRINSNIAAAYSAIESKGGQPPEVQNSSNLASTIASIPQVEYSSKEVYSTEEQVIGTCIDGRRLYRKFFKKDNIINTGMSWVKIADPIPYLDTIISFKSTANTSVMCAPVCSGVSGWDLLVWYFKQPYQNYQLGLNYINTNVDLVGGTIYVVLEYTKTTD